MELLQLKQTVEALPQEIETKPVLQELVRQYESIGSRVAQVLAAQIQQVPVQPPHPYGLCHNADCPSCIHQAQEIISHGRKTMVGDLDSAFTWANRPDIAEVVGDIYEAWEQAGKPRN